MNNRVEDEIGLGFFIAAFTALKKVPPVAAMPVLGDLSVQGNIKGLRSLAEPLPTDILSRTERFTCALL